MKKVANFHDAITSQLVYTGSFSGEKREVFEKYIS